MNISHRLLFLCVLPCSLMANPKGAKVTHGTAQLSSPKAGSLHIQTSDRAIINWEDFSIGKGETACFLQPSANSAVLNRVVGQNASLILGKLQANGQVVLVNPQGVIIGKDGVIHAGSFFATTHELSDADFLNRNHIHLRGDSKNGIVNEGSITATNGDIILVGCSVTNKGTLEALEGTVGIGAGADIFVKPSGTDKIYIQPDTTSMAEIDNQGVIQALQVELKSNNNPFSQAVRHSGNINAVSTVVKNGRVIIVSGKAEVDGTIQASGGEVAVLGDRVHLKENAIIDVSSSGQAGDIYIGGGFQGKEPELLCSKATIVDKGATLLSNGLESGNAGKVILWSDESTQFRGEVQAKGGDIEGDGGFIEVSGKKHLDFKGFTTTQAKNGATGTLLLDPANLSITNSPSANVTGATPFEPTGAGAILDVNDLNTALGSSNVIVRTNNDAFAGNGDITIDGSISWIATNTLLIDSVHDIIFSDQQLGDPGTIRSTGANASITLTADHDIIMTNFFNFPGALSNAVIETQGVNANIILTAGNSINLSPTGQDGGGALTVPVIGATSGSVSVTATQDITIAADFTNPLIMASGVISTSGASGTITLSAGNNLTFPVAANPSNSFLIRSVAADVNLTTQNGTPGTISLLGAHVGADDGLFILSGDGSTPGNIGMNAARLITQAGPIQVKAGDGGGSIVANSACDLSASGDLTLQADFGNIQVVDSTVAANNIIVQAGQTVAMGGSELLATNTLSIASATELMPCGGGSAGLMGFLVINDTILEGNPGNVYMYAYNHLTIDLTGTTINGASWDGDHEFSTIPFCYDPLVLNPATPFVDYTIFLQTPLPSPPPPPAPPSPPAPSPRPSQNPYDLPTLQLDQAAASMSKPIEKGFVFSSPKLVWFSCLLFLRRMRKKFTMRWDKYKMLMGRI